ncbi:MAG TPA: hypothetical protein PKJ99_03540 [Thermoanaerobaculales bacterium]|nr:hypothetical protein [Thermoanaerobaculales bacterium]HPA79964.1 hypothetical protein [Thermoanaerobaculales bacterium]HQN96689.1 hypothetical protein [Thermoanaerobaculales bacterium]HQP43385.1 hypothetical protein [Thermoanaerobaculales bacterium]
MQARICLLMLAMALAAGCAAPPPEAPDSPAADQPAAPSEQPAPADQGGAVADEGFESGRSETLQAVEGPAAEQAE